MGGIVGIDHAAYYRTAERLGYDTRAMALFLPYIEDAFLRKMREMHEAKRVNDSDS